MMQTGMIGGGNAVEDVLESDLQTLSVEDLDHLQQLLHCDQQAEAPDSILITQTLAQLQITPVTLAAAYFIILLTCYTREFVKVPGVLAFTQKCEPEMVCWHQWSEQKEQCQMVSVFVSADWS